MDTFKETKEQKREEIDKDIQELQELLDSLDSSNEEENTGEPEETAEEALQALEKQFGLTDENEKTEENYENCYDCTNRDCEFNLHGKKWIADIDLPLFIGSCIGDEIMSNACRNMIHILEIKDALFSIEDEEIREEAFDKVKAIQENLCKTIELIHIAPDTVYEIV